MRDFKTVFDISKKIKNLHLLVISNEYKKLFKKETKNIIIKGFRKTNNFSISDKKLREIIRGAICVILPIKETLQPSGQSVALQTFACKTPVLISQYDGLWDKERLKNEHNCVLVKQGESYAKWLEIINNIENDSTKYKFLTKMRMKILLNLFLIKGI